MTYYIKDKMLNACISEQNKRIVNQQNKRRRHRKRYKKWILRSKKRQKRIQIKIIKRLKYIATQYKGYQREIAIFEAYQKNMFKEELEDWFRDVVEKTNYDLIY